VIVASRYSLNHKRGTPSPNPFSGNERCDGLEALQAALSVLRSVAASDPDHARHANAQGYSRSDGRRGHYLAGMSDDVVSRSPSLTSEVLRMAARYRRQASYGQRWRMGLERQGDLFDR
jgi:hypothetical protein